MYVLHSLFVVTLFYTLTESAGDCQDKDPISSCIAWQKNGFCTRNPDQAKALCKYTCGYCEPDECHDRNRQCEMWTKGDFCTSLFYGEAYAAWECQYSCNKCDYEVTCSDSLGPCDPSNQCSDYPGALCVSSDIGCCARNNLGLQKKT